MKTIILSVCAVLMLLVSACDRDQVRSFIPGTYVNQAGSEFSKASDTLVIEAGSNNRYLIQRKTGFNRIRAGKVGKREYETEVWAAVYDEQTKILKETRRGKELVFDPSAGTLRISSRVYRKIN
jgi:hypothetical protein